jgi:hypothetical protein
MPGIPKDEIDSHTVFDQVAFALAGDVDDATMKHVLGALMDRIGVPMMQLEPWKHEPAIVELFAERGVTLVAEAPNAEPNED